MLGNKRARKKDQEMEGVYRENKKRGESKRKKKI
jgi:hypothetical protein